MSQKDASSQAPKSDSRVKYDFALLFFKTNADACGKLEYEITTKLMALSKQAARGQFIAENEPALGWFDFVGTDRRNAWKELGDMSKADAMTNFCSVLSENVPEFASWLTARLEEKARKEQEERERLERERLERERAERERKERLRQQELERERLELERQRAKMNEFQSPQKQVGNGAASTPGPAWGTPSRQPVEGEKAFTATPGGTNVQLDVKQFREMLRDDPKGCMNVSSGEVARIKVTNQSPGKSILRWQFCTEFYDIGFGVEFEPADTQEDEANLKTILPIMRIAADQNVSKGTHCEPTAGNWVLVFDNSYSYMRSKTIYLTIHN